MIILMALNKKYGISLASSLVLICYPYPQQERQDDEFSWSLKICGVRLALWINHARG